MLVMDGFFGMMPRHSDVTDAHAGSAPGDGQPGGRCPMRCSVFTGIWGGSTTRIFSRLLGSEDALVYLFIYISVISLSCSTN